MQDTHQEIKRVIDRLKSLETERAPSTILDKGDAKILLDYIDEIEGSYDRIGIHPRFVKNDDNQSGQL